MKRTLLSRTRPLRVAGVATALAINTVVPAIGLAAENPTRTLIAESSWTITAPLAGAPSARVELNPSSGTLTLSAFRGVQTVLAPAAHPREPFPQPRWRSTIHQSHQNHQKWVCMSLAA